MATVSDLEVKVHVDTESAFEQLDAVDREIQVLRSNLARLARQIVSLSHVLNTIEINVAPVSDRTRGEQ